MARDVRADQYVERPYDHTPIFFILQLCTLSFSFLSLAAFGGYLLAKDEVAQRISLMIPLGLEAVWVFGLISIKGDYPPSELFNVIHAWTRYSLAIPASILAAAGLIAQQRAFRRAGLVRFGQDAMWAAVAFAWYGIVGQLFTNASALPPSNVINDVVFLRLFGFPIQLLRALLAGVASIYVIRFLRAFQVETDQKIADLQAERLKESQQRETTARRTVPARGGRTGIGTATHCTRSARRNGPGPDRHRTGAARSGEPPGT